MPDTSSKDSKPSPLPPGWTEGCAVEHYKGGCHKDCGKIAFEFDHPHIDTGSKCNCSICQMRDTILVYVPEDKFKFTKGSYEDMTKYQFNKKLIDHLFCPNCGSPCIAQGYGCYAVNLKATEGIDVSKLKITQHDGAKL